MSEGQKESDQAIPLPREAVESLADGQRRLAEVQGQIESYVSGLRHGLKVPEGWELDLKAKAFVPSKDGCDAGRGGSVNKGAEGHG